MPDEVTLNASHMLTLRDGAPAARRSEVFHAVVTGLRDDNGLVPGQIEALMRRYPNGIAAKYASRVRKMIDASWRKGGNEDHDVVREENGDIIARDIGLVLHLAPKKAPGPPPCRDDLLVANWLSRELPPRDYLLGGILCTTSRWLVIGETGVGKTLFAPLSRPARGVLGWKGRRRARVMYLDGELPAETFKERIEIIAGLYGNDIALFGYNRDVLSEEDMPPLNTPAGVAWLASEVDGIKPDIIFFDSIMCLTVGAMSDEEGWAPVNMLAQQLSARRIAQAWLHHTGHDVSKGYGTKTREWKMDTVIMLSSIEGDDGPEEAAAFQLEFTKARLRTPSNFDQFATKIVRRTPDGFVFEAGQKRSSRGDTRTFLRSTFMETYERLADGVAPAWP